MSKVVCALVCLGALLTAAPATAATPNSGTLSDPSSTLRFTGHFDPDDSDSDEYTLKIQLPANVWDEAGGVQIGIHYAYDPENNDLDLEVYDENESLDDELLGPAPDWSSASGDSDAESLTLRSAANGEYEIKVVPYTLPEGGLDYEGYVQVERDPAAAPLRDLLPNLTSLPQKNVTIDPDFDLVGGTCGYDEFSEDGARRCLRFDQIIYNTGTGPLELRYELQGFATTQRLNQRVYRSDGTWYDRQADTYEFHPTHAHFHYKNFAESKLYASDAAGTRGALVRSGAKNGFCLIDVENTAWGQFGDASKRYGSCLPEDEQKEQPTLGSPLGTQVNGISAGWADVYNWYLADQYIEITGVPDGWYLLETTADSPTNTLLESDETDNATSVLVWICGDSANLASEAPKPC